METKRFQDKYCQLTFKDGFILRGWVDDVNDAGVIFRTEQKSSFISWDEIAQLREE